MELSARNQLKGRITEVKMGQVMAEVTIRVGENDIVAAITRKSVEHLDLKQGDEVMAIIKSTEVMVAK